MLASPQKPFSVPIRDKLDKLIRRLSSDSDGECVATVRAISRTLSGSGLDWHDLAVRVTAQTGAEMLAEFGGGATQPPPRPASTSSYSPPKPKPPPSPWPTFRTTSAQDRLRWMDAARTSPHYPGMKKRREFDALYDQLYRKPHEGVTRQESNLWNTVIRTLWLLGMRIDPRMAA